MEGRRKIVRTRAFGGVWRAFSARPLSVRRSAGTDRTFPRGRIDSARFRCYSECSFGLCEQTGKEIYIMSVCEVAAG